MRRLAVAGWFLVIRIFVWRACATRVLQARPIVIGAPVQVSEANRTRPHYEMQIAADPTDPTRLIAGSLVQGDARLYESPYPINVVVYSSRDGGSSWRQALELNGRQYNNDPACAFGPDGKAYFAFFGGDMFGAANTWREPMYRSDDGGVTWQQVSTLATIPDRPFLSVDDTSGMYRGRAYLYGDEKVPLPGSLRTVFGFWVYRSMDGFRTSKRVALPMRGTEFFTGASNGVVSPDGTYAFAYHVLPSIAQANWPPHSIPLDAANGHMVFVSSHDGGVTLDKSVVIGDSYTRFGPMLMGSSALAVDRSTGSFHGRLYVAWIDVRTGRGEIRFARSSDGGKTWSASPTVRVKMPDGTTVVKKADPSLYTTVRFITAGAIAPHQTVAYSYEVRVK